MKRSPALIIATTAFCLAVSSCNNETAIDADPPRDSTKVVNSVTPETPAPGGMPVGTPEEETLIQGVAKITAAYPEVIAEVSGTEVVLRGSVEKNREAELIKAIEALKPKKLTNELVKK